MPVKVQDLYMLGTFHLGEKNIQKAWIELFTNVYNNRFKGHALTFVAGRCIH